VSLLADKLVMSPEQFWQGDVPNKVSLQAIQTYRQYGCLILKGFVSPMDIEPIRSDLVELVRLQFREEPTLVSLCDDPAYDFLGAGLVRLSEVARTRVGYVYDAAMKMLSVRRFGLDARLAAAAEQLLGSKLLSMSNNLIVRIDLPAEEKFLYDWHQDYPYSMVSLNGCTAWIPLNVISMDTGPVVLNPGSHLDGLRKVKPRDAKQSLFVQEQPVAAAEQVCVAGEVGDVYLFDLMLLHRSSANVSRIPRLTVSYRYCDMADSRSSRSGWPCFYSQGREFRQVYPEFVESQGS
jgi:hypothetical protein